MPPSWLFVVVLASALSQEALSLAFGPIAANSSSPLAGNPSSAPTTVSRNPGSIHLPGAQQNRPLQKSNFENRNHLPTSPDVISLPTPDASDNKRFDRPRRQLGFFEPQPPQRPQRQQRPNNANRPKNIGGSGAISFPSDPPAWGNNFNSPRPNRPGMARPPWGQKPPPPPARPDEDRFAFGNGPPMRTTTRRPRPTPPTTRAPDVGVATRPTPAPTRAGCNCPSTPEFNPVCGGDRVTYSNAGKLKCANFCGNPVKMVHLGSCITTTTTTSAPTPPSRVPTPPPRRPTNVREPPQWTWT